jgi:hypothetical protein
MQITLIEQATLRATPGAAFALALDPERFPPLFRGCGPIPSMRSITLHAPPAVGATRTLVNNDGSTLTETITVLEPARRHAYLLSGIRLPLSLLARAGHADWTFTANGAATDVVWRYRFDLSHWLAWPLAFVLLQVFMRTAMRRCLQAMDAHLAATRG